MKVCKHCGKEFERQGQLNLHQYHCQIKQYKKENVSRETKEIKEELKEECQHSFRLLNGNIPIEKRAINSGYVEVCTKCQNVQ
jgi:hypothetical protein